MLMWCHGGLVVRSQDRRIPGSKTDSTGNIWPWCTLNLTGQTPSRSCGAEVWRRGDSQVSSSSFDRGSKLGGPCENSCRAASKRDVSKTKRLCSSDTIPMGGTN
ncbi:hypothetical protein AVEN_5744-1 [Araneus ventricosus]|uniref:Uncharacterized protein n=1 Tax=Araneus ventricosus TaxID=182803 RepID=A0A4Y2DZF4_ARAVE|nr:hypothetical protein AVEN_5744-1 [Araneus ventricosus]